MGGSVGMLGVRLDVAYDMAAWLVSVAICEGNQEQMSYLLVHMMVCILQVTHALLSQLSHLSVNDHISLLLGFKLVVTAHAQVTPFSFLEARPIGVMQMIDQGERDDKIIAVHLHDPAFNGFTDISQLPKHRLAEIKSFFEDYKKNENKVMWLQHMMLWSHMTVYVYCMPAV